jgi:hypothetical protein
MVRLLRMAEDHAIKTAVIFKLAKHGEPKTFRVHLSNRGQVISWPGHSHRKNRLHSGERLRSNSVASSKTTSRRALLSSMDWKKRFEPGRFGVGKINAACKSRVIIGVRLPAVGPVILLPVEIKVHP